MKYGNLDAWVTSLVAAGSTFSSINDMEMQFLNAQGYTTGSLDDRWFDYLRAKGYTGGLQEMWKAAEAADDLLSVSVEGDVDAWFTSSVTGGFWKATNAYQDDALTTPAVTANDPMKVWVNNRTTPYTGITSDFGRLRAPAIGNASLVDTSDSTYGLVANCFRTGTQYSVMYENAAAATLAAPMVLGLRIKVPTTLDGTGGGLKLGGLNSGQQAGISEWGTAIGLYAGNTRVGTFPAASGYAGQWVTLIYLGDGTLTGANKNRLYINSDTIGSPDWTKDAAVANTASLSLEIESNMSSVEGVLVYKLFAYGASVDNIDISILKQWLEE